MFEMVRGDLADLPTGGHFRSTKPHQSPDLFKREPEFSRAPYESQSADVRRIVHPPATCSARRRRQHLDAFVISDGLDVYAGEAGYLAYGKSSGWRTYDWSHAWLLIL